MDQFLSLAPDNVVLSVRYKLEEINQICTPRFQQSNKLNPINTTHPPSMPSLLECVIIHNP